MKVSCRLCRGATLSVVRCNDRNGKFVINPQLEGTGGGYASTPSDLHAGEDDVRGKTYDALLRASSDGARLRCSARS